MTHYGLDEEMGAGLNVPAAWGIPVVGARKTIGVSGKGTYYLVLKDGSLIKIGSVAVLLSPRRTLLAIATAVGRVIPRYGHEEWRGIAQAILTAAGPGVPCEAK